MEAIMGERRFCYDCVHFRGYEESTCRRPLSDKLDIVTGRPENLLRTSAYRERGFGRTLFGRERCGPNATFWAPTSAFIVKMTTQGLASRLSPTGDV
jgi:hypothetical protein